MKLFRYIIICLIAILLGWVALELNVGTGIGASVAVTALIYELGVGEE